MKKLLSIMSIFTLIPTLSVSVMSCTTHSSENDVTDDLSQMDFRGIYVKVNNPENITKIDVKNALLQVKESIQEDLWKYNKNADVERDVDIQNEIEYTEHVPKESTIYIYPKSTGLFGGHHALTGLYFVTLDS